jgi:hypothetical protein
MWASHLQALPAIILGICTLLAAASLFTHATTIAPVCPQLVAKLSALPSGKLAARPGGRFTVAVNVWNKGSTDLQGAGLRIAMPFSMDKMSASTSGHKGTHGVYMAPPNVYWPTFSLKAGKKTTFKLTGTVSPCQEVGTFHLDAAVYLASRNCSSPALPSKRVRTGRNGGGWG